MLLTNLFLLFRFRLAPRLRCGTLAVPGLLRRPIGRRAVPRRAQTVTRLRRRQKRRCHTPRGRGGRGARRLDGGGIRGRPGGGNLERGLGHEGGDVVVTLCGHGLGDGIETGSDHVAPYHQ